MKVVGVAGLLAANVCMAGPSLSPEDIYDKVSGSVLTIEVANSAREKFVGSGFLAFEPGLAVTAWHVVHDATQIRAWGPDRKPIKVLGLVAKDEKHDIAIIRVETNSSPLMALSTETPRVGSRAYVIGSPKGLDFSLADGLISQIRVMDGLCQYQLSCPISPGNSGGPVVNDRGEVVGMVAWRKADAQNLGFAVPARDLMAFNGTNQTVANVSSEDHQFVKESLLPAKTEDLAAFQQALASSGGKKVTVTLNADNSTRIFTFEAPIEESKPLR